MPGLAKVDDAHGRVGDVAEEVGDGDWADKVFRELTVGAAVNDGFGILGVL